jgi:hypothetical protein
MKTLTKLSTFSAFLLILAFGFSACQKENGEKEIDISKLPPETQIGANTFGCYLNGKLFIPDTLWSFEDEKWIPYLDIFAGYIPLVQNHLGEWGSLVHISAYSSPEHDFIGFTVHNPSEGEFNLEGLTLVIRNYHYGGIAHQGNSELNRESLDSRIIITRFDTINNIVSGTFEIAGRYHYILTDDSIVEKHRFIDIEIVNGRFDVPLWNHGSVNRVKNFREFSTYNKVANFEMTNSIILKNRR